jgi:hypothetical protein
MVYPAGLEQGNDIVTDPSFIHPEIPEGLIFSG